jgi:dihydrofolate reductase
MHTFIIAAISADGFLADKTDQVSTAWTSKADMRYFAQRTKQAGIMVMGSTTYNTIGHPLKDRITIVLTSKPNAIKNAKPLEQLTAHQPQNSFPTSLYTANLSPTKLIQHLEKLNYPECAICGGSSVYTQFAQAGLVDTYLLTLEPHIFGQGVPLFNQSLHLPLTLKQTTQLSQNSLLLEYAPAIG